MVSVVKYHASGFKTHEIHDVVDEAQQVGLAAANALEILELFGRCRPTNAELHQLGVATNGVERRAELMAHDGEEFHLRLIGRLCSRARKFGLRHAPRRFLQFTPIRDVDAKENDGLQRSLLGVSIGRVPRDPALLTVHSLHRHFVARGVAQAKLSQEVCRVSAVARVDEYIPEIPAFECLRLPAEHRVHGLVDEDDPTAGRKLAYDGGRTRDEVSIASL